MSNSSWENLKAIFHAAREVAPGDRPAYLDRVCEGNESLREAVESLLLAHKETGFVDEPAYKAAAELLMQDRSLTGGQIIGRYRIVSLIGEGGMGQVYLAQDIKLHRKVSLKFLTTEIAHDQSQRRFEQEARAASALNHPNIITIHEIGEEDGKQFIATEYVEGQTLRERLRSSLELNDVLDIAIQVTSALVAAHRINIIHRDIKPENIMIRKDDGLVKVLDFGLAKMTQKRSRNVAADSKVETAMILNTAPGLLLGTVAYMSPEQARGESVDERTDIWSLGIVLYEMIAGCSPFLAGTSNEIISAILSKHATPQLSRYSCVVPERLEEIVEKALAKDKEERYQTTKDLLIDLKRFQQTLQNKPAHDPVSSERLEVAKGNENATQSQRSPAITQRPSSAEYISNQVRSHKRGVLIGLALLLLTVSGTLIYLFRSKEAASQAQPKIRSLAVLPLKSLGTNDDYLGLGIADAVIRRISQTGKITVRPTSAVRRFTTEETDGLSAAKQLGVDSVLEGTVQHANDRLRVSVNLLRVNDGVSLWADSFDMATADIFTIQDRVSQQVASRLRLQLDPAQQALLTMRSTSNPEAYEYYVKGRTNAERTTTSIGDREAIDAAISYFKKAIELDPKYALAHAELGQMYMWMANFTDPDNPVWVSLAQQSLSQAETLDSQLAEIHDARFQYYFSRYGNWDLAQAAREARQAIALNPNVGHMALGTIYDHLGLDEATGLQETQREWEIDPTNTAAQARMIESYELYGRFDDAIEAQRRFFGTPGPPFALIAKGRLDEAQPLVEDAIKKNSGDLRARGRLALILALRGKFQDAEALSLPILQEARNNRAYHHIVYDIACVYALGGKPDEAVRWLRAMADTGMPNYPLYARDPHLDRIRNTPVFIQFMAEIKTRWEGLKQQLESNP